MFVRLTLADVNEGEMDNALEYVKNTVIPSYDGIPGLLGLAACASNDGGPMKKPKMIRSTNLTRPLQVLQKCFLDNLK